MLLLSGFVFLLGLVIGSFLNVCIYRIPHRLSVVRPGSSCPSCGHRLAWRDNLPLLSYLLLGRRCRHCEERISWIYPVVELSSGVLTLALFLRFGLTPALLLNAFFVWAIIVLIFIDLRERILPNPITLGGLLVGLGCAPLQEGGLLGVSQGDYVAAYLASGMGVVLGGGTLWLVAELYYRIREEEGLGFGDVKMMAMIGAFVGWRFAWLTIFLGSIMGTIVGGTYIYVFSKGRRYELPYGSFLGIAAIIIILFLR